ncbi:MAG: uroporphyrinogen decarboxylase family protein [Planctomycetota bacterium]|jgi:uroporphyrinogen decarboxylase
MNAKERYIAALTFGNPDKVPFQPGGPRESTLKRWYSEGLPEDRSWFDVLCEDIGVALETQDERPRPHPGVNFLMNPMFEEKVLEHTNGHYICQDWKGNICEISDEFDVSYLRSARDFVTRRWIKCPVETRADWEDMKKRYVVDDPTRYDDDFEDNLPDMQNRDYNTALAIHGPFWQLREWCGFEGLCMLCIEDPEFVDKMAGFWKGFVSKVMARALDAGVVDHLFICEDMAYKEKAMISPDMCRRFLMPSWKRWTKEAKQAGVSIVEIDSDGKVDELIPLWIEAGVNVNSPVEVAAGNDINAYRKEFGHQIAFCGGVDKRAMAKGGKVIEDELRRIEPVVRDGGFIPSCDHGVPSDISWPDFKHYSKLLAEMTGWL